MGSDPGSEGRRRQCVVDRSDGALAIVCGERAPGFTDSENGILAFWRAGLHRRGRGVKEPRFRPLEGLLRLFDPPGLQRLSGRLEKRTSRLVRGKGRAK